MTRSLANYAFSTKLQDLWRYARTLRWHTVGHAEQNNADHTFGVLLIILMMHPDPSRALIKSALIHDLPEGITGDIPSMFKEVIGTIEFETVFAKKLGIRPVLDAEEKLWLRAADSLELLLYAVHRVSMGDRRFMRSAQIVLERECLKAPPPELVDTVEWCVQQIRS